MTAHADAGVLIRTRTSAAVTEVPIRAVMRGAVRGLALGATLVSLAAAAYAGRNLHLFGPLGDGLVGAGLVALAMAAVNGVFSLVSWSGRRVVRLLTRGGSGRVSSWADRALRTVAHPLVASVVFIGLVLTLGRAEGALSLFSALVAFEIPIGAGAAVGMLLGAGWALRAGAAGHTRAAGASAMLAGLLVATTASAWAILPGAGDPVVREPASVLDAIPQLDLPDPSAPGPHEVVHVTYGSGTSTRRPEYGEAVTWRTPTVDASGALAARDGVSAFYGDLLWGFGTDALPVNGLAWYAEYPGGPMPVVLIVHGNHAAGEPSDRGYAYLGEHLASHGMFAVSVDENALNGDAFNDYGGAEMGVRAWTLLRHLDQLRTWNADPAHPLHGRLDLDRVALIGHSRGGEAAALAAEIEAEGRKVAGMPATPTGFGIRAVVALAPSDGMGRGTPPSPSDIDYLVMQGARDADLPAYSGLRTYHRVDWEEGGHLKVAVYSQRANHGRFNTVWDDGDAGPIHSWMLDRGSLLSMGEQGRLTKAVVGAFLLRSLEGRTEYDAFFREPRSGRAWLPDDVVQTHWESSERVVATSLGTTRVDRGPLHVDGFSHGGTADPLLRDGTRQADPAVQLVSDGGATLTVDVPRDLAGQVDPAGHLTLSLASGTGSSLPEVEITLRDAGGATRTVSLADVAPARPPLPVRLWKLSGLGERYLPDAHHSWPAERFLQTYAIPLDAFGTVGAFDVTDLRSVEIRFGAGSVFVDDLGFEPAD